MAGEAAVFRSLTPEVQQHIARKLVAGNPLNSAFNDALQMAQTSDFAAKEALQIRDASIEGDNYLPSMDEVISSGLPEETVPQAIPLAPDGNVAQSGQTLPPITDNPPYGDEFPAGTAPGSEANTPGSGYTTAALAAGAGAYAARDEILTRRGMRPKTVAPTSDPAQELAFALDGQQNKGQMDMLGAPTQPNAPLSDNQRYVDPAQSDMQLGDPRQMELALGELQPMENNGKVVGFVQEDGNGGYKFYDADQNYIGANLDEIKQNVPMPVESVEAGKPRIKASVESVQDASTTVETAPPPTRKTSRGTRKKVAGYDDIPAYKATDLSGGQNVKRLDGYTLSERGQPDILSYDGQNDLNTNRAIKEKDATRFRDQDVHGTGEMQRVVTNADGSKTNVNIDHPRWSELDLDGTKITVDAETGYVYDKKGFQITNTESLQRFKNTLGKGGKYIAKGSKKSLRAIAQAIKIVVK